MDGSGEQPSMQTTAASEVKVTVERTNGSYKCIICNHSVRPQLKQALAAASGAGMVDGAHLELNCPTCTGEVYPAACGSAAFHMLCSTSGQDTVEQWKPRNQPHTPCAGSGASGQNAAAAGDQRSDHVPPAPAACAVRPKSKFLPFEQALPCARSLKLKSRKEWHEWCKSGERPANMPSTPHKIYKHDGWQGYGHWLGTGKVGAKKDQQFLPFKKALLQARSLQLKGVKEWQVWSKSGERPANMPSSPHTHYQHDGWQGYRHWLGTVEFLPFEQALPCARSLKLKSQKEWHEWCKSGERPANMPSTPHKIYKHDGWQGYGHWLVTDTVATKDHQFLPFKKALLQARSLELKSRIEWREWRTTSARPADMPSAPDQVYKHQGWQGWRHWLVTPNIGVKKYHQFLPFKEALVYARSLKLKSHKKWREWCSNGVGPANIPSAPNQVYEHDGWQGWGHWLGTGAVANKDKQFLPFKKALLYARTFKLAAKKDWQAWSKSSARPANMPSAPEKTYKHDGWQGYRHWLGTGTVAQKLQQVLPFKEALLHARSLNLKNNTEWEAWCKSGLRPANMPSCPRQVYTHDGWQGFGHWLGT